MPVPLLASAALALQAGSMVMQQKARKQEQRAIRKMAKFQEKALKDKRDLEMQTLYRTSSRNQSSIVQSVAKSGVTMSGSALFAAVESAELAAIDAAILRTSYQSQIDLNRMSARSQIRGSKTAGAAEILSSLGSMAGQMELAGMFSGKPATTSNTSYGVLRSDMAPARYSGASILNPSRFIASGR